MIAALAAAGGLYYNGQSLDASRRQNTVAEQGQATDRLAQASERYTRAVDQLDRVGADHLQARLGAIYALICRLVCQVGRVKRCPRPSPWTPLRCPDSAGGGERVGVDALSV